MRSSLIGSRAPGREAPLAFREMLPLVAGPGLAGRVCRAPCRHVGPTGDPGPPVGVRDGMGRVELEVSCGGAHVKCHAGHAIRGWMPGSTVGGRNGRTDGEVLSRGAASWCRGVE